MSLDTHMGSHKIETMKRKKKKKERREKEEKIILANKYTQADLHLHKLVKRK